MEIRLGAARRLCGEVRVPGDKSISHRAVILGALAEGVTEVSGFLMGEDCLSTVRCLRDLGVPIEGVGEPAIRVCGNGIKSLREPGGVLDAGNSGTTIRMLLGVLAGQDFFSVITGDESLRRRPMGRVVGPLQEMGAHIWGRGGNKLAPLAVRGTQLTGAAYRSPVASAQVKSAILLAGLHGVGETRVEEPILSRDHTERMLAAFGARIKACGPVVHLAPGPLRARPISVPGDMSSAAFFLVAGSIVPQGEIVIRDVGINLTRTGILDALGQMGADITILNERSWGNEPVADLLVRPARLRGTIIKGEIIPRLIDELPVLAVAAAVADGATEIRDATELKVKETDRIKAMATELRKMGVEAVELPDGMIIRGGKLHAAVCDSCDDHRVAMAMAVAGLAAAGETVVRDAECVNISFPGFVETLRSLTE